MKTRLLLLLAANAFFVACSNEEVAETSTPMPKIQKGLMIRFRNSRKQIFKTKSFCFMHAYITMLMIRLGTTMIFLGAVSPSHFCTSGFSISSGSISFWVYVTGKEIFRRILPLKETG